MAVSVMRAVAPERATRPVVRRPAPPSRVPEAPVADRTTRSAVPPRPAYVLRPDQIPPQLGAERLDARIEVRRTDQQDARLDARQDGRQDARLDERMDERLDERLDEHADQRVEGAAGGEMATRLVGGAVRGGAGARRGAARQAQPRGGAPAATAEGEGGPAEQDIETVPQPETGPVSLPVETLGLPPTWVPFDAPLRLELRPELPAQERTPDLDRHADAFAEAAAAAARLHATLNSLASREAEVARDGETRRAALRQRDLDGALELLDTDLATARGTMDVGEAACQAEIASAGRRARARIRTAARRARGALSAKAKEVANDTGEKGTERVRADGIAKNADGRITELRQAGGEAADALHRMFDAPAAAYPEEGTALQSAKNEAIVERLPPRATDRERVMRGGTTGMANNLTPTVERLRVDITNAFAPFRQMEHTLTVTAPQAVDGARDAALKQVRDTVDSLSNAVAAGRARTEAALVRQHDTARAQLIDTGRRRAAAERDTAARQATSQIEAATGMAAAQGGALRALVETLRPEQKRPATDFATVVVRSAEGLRGRLAETAAALQRQVSEGTESFDTVAQPVSRSIGGYIEPIRRTYATQLADLRTRLTNLDTEVTTIFNEGRASGAGANADAAAPPAPPAAPIEGAARSAREFVERARRVAGDARTDDGIAAFADRVGTAVHSDVNTRTNTVSNGLKGFWGPDVEMVMSGLRGLTKRRGQAVIARYAERPGRDLVFMIQWRFKDNLSFPSTCLLYTSDAADD